VVWQQAAIIDDRTQPVDGRVGNEGEACSLAGLLAWVIIIMLPIKPYACVGNPMTVYV
jgi:hypothetical protein